MALFDIVIRGRGTWAAARLATLQGDELWSKQIEQTLIARVLLQDTNMKFGVSDL